MFSVNRAAVALEATHKLDEPERLRLDRDSSIVNTSQGFLTVILLRVGLNLSGNTEGPIPQPWSCIHLFPGYLLKAHETLEVHISPAFPGQSYHLEILPNA